MQYIFRAEVDNVDMALEPDTSGRKINSGCDLSFLVMKYLLSDHYCKYLHLSVTTDWQLTVR